MSLSDVVILGAGLTRRGKPAAGQRPVESERYRLGGVVVMAYPDGLQRVEAYYYRRM
jgi:hypothetical protein